MERKDLEQIRWILQERDAYRTRLRELKKAAGGQERLELQRGLTQRILRAEKAVQRAEAALDGLPTMQRRVLYLRYIDGLPWSLVSEKLGYSEPTCYALHRKALEALSHT